MLNTRQLAAWLREAQRAHTDYARLHIEPEDSWAEWYAAWLLPKLEADTFITVIETVFPELDPRNLNAAKGGMKL